jgi:Outer membrane protein
MTKNTKEYRGMGANAFKEASWQNKGGVNMPRALAPILTNLLLITMIFFTSHKAFGYEKARFTLNEAVRFAREKHPKILIAMNAVDKQREAVKSVRMFHPNISFHGGYNVLREQDYFGVSITQDLDSIFDHKRNLDKAALDLENAEYEYELIKQEIIKEVKDAYSEYMSKHDLLKLKLRSLHMRRKERRLSVFNFREGRISMDEYLSKKQMFENAAHEAREARLNFDTAKGTLYSKMGYEE